ncbi:MAG TPA: hypothetical protein VGI65_12895 [Steroidobacteraceae bacterium]|jgi:hypothetical protein
MKSTIRNRTIATMLLLMLVPLFSVAQVSVGISVNVAPPVIPVYEQPPIPADGYLWTPGYWAWNPDAQDYYWVPGTWVEAPQPGFLWTPGYWAAVGGAFLWHAGYWGPHIGFYGGVNYGFGYTGVGYQGAYWQGGHVFYNRDVVNVGSTHITNVYNKTVINNVNVTRVSYNGGSGGVRAQPTSAETAAEHERHVQPTTAQVQHVQAAKTTPALRASSNHGSPPIAASPRPGAFEHENQAREPQAREPAAAARQPQAVTHEPQAVEPRQQAEHTKPVEQPRQAGQPKQVMQPKQVTQPKPEQPRSEQPKPTRTAQAPHPPKPAAHPVPHPAPPEHQEDHEHH